MRKIKESVIKEKMDETPWIPKIIEGEKQNFCCPLCGSVEYQVKEEELNLFTPISSRNRPCVLYYFCAGCGLMFKKTPAEFTRATKAKKTKGG